MASRIEAGITIEGSVRGDGELTVAGRVRGVLTLVGTLVIEEGGSVEAEVEASAVVVAGLLTGSVTAHDELRVLAGGCVDARVRAARLAMADGAIFRGEFMAPTTTQASQNAPTPRLGATRAPQQLAAASGHAAVHGSDAIPPIPTLQKSPQAHKQVAAPPPPVARAARQTVPPPPPDAPSSSVLVSQTTTPTPAPMDSIAPIPTTPAPASKHARDTIPPPPRVPTMAAEAPRARPFAAPASKGRGRTPRADVDAVPPTQPRARERGERNAPLRMPALPRGRTNARSRGENS
jgi:cytoskeletal protein CcmA (bactofilin family)